jgi:putative hydrolase of HD superfamily
MDENAEQFLSLLGRLKHLDRKGWTYYPLDKVETVAGHMYRMALSAFLLPKDQFDVVKIMQICLVHDIGESIIGDITPRDQVDPAHKHQREELAVRDIAALLPTAWAREELFNLYMEYESGTSAEAAIARDLDKYDMVFQAFEYEQNYKTDLSTFFDTTKELFSTDIIKQWAARLYTKRDQLRSLDTST